MKTLSKITSLLGAAALMFSASSMAAPDNARFAETLTPDNAILAMIDHQTGLMVGVRDMNPAQLRV